MWASLVPPPTFLNAVDISKLDPELMEWAHLTLRLLWRVARAVLKEYPGVLKDPLAPSDSCGVAARAVQKQCSCVLGNPLTLSDSCGSVARAVPSVLAGGAC
ncbi:hypothetical protein NDU88_005939 [Pleurodeles waltl]|uniref:Uncharacterized protein n=1 Tax=Pleurodeles waltl TaxID=8319 RepID=A0AAV7QKD3_PLEWA|nr:hypothetical protein NDU88_005939 [Pleurodeles waltl]